MREKLKEYQKICRDCENTFRTIQSFSRICPNCKERNHKVKVKNGLFGSKAGQV